MNNYIQILNINDPSMWDPAEMLPERDGKRLILKTIPGPDKGLEKLGDILSEFIVSDYDMPDISVLRLFPSGK